MDMQNPGPRGRSSSINPGPGAAVEGKTPGVARGGCWCLELTDASRHMAFDYEYRATKRKWNILVKFGLSCSSQTP